MSFISTGGFGSTGVVPPLSPPPEPIANGLTPFDLDPSSISIPTVLLKKHGQENFLAKQLEVQQQPISRQLY